MDVGVWRWTGRKVRGNQEGGEKIRALVVQVFVTKKREGGKKKKRRKKKSERIFNEFEV